MPGRAKRKIHQYNDENLVKALEAVRNGASQRETCRNYGIPRATLQDRIKGRVAEKPRQMGPDPYLSKENEQTIVEWIIQLSKCGFPLKKEELLSTVQKIVRDGNLETPFKDGRPGQKWYKSFINRHPEISLRSAEAIEKSRAKVTKQYILSWFRDLVNFLENINASDVLLDPSRIFNADESGFSLHPKSGKVLGPRGYKNLYEIKKGSEKENITVLVTFSADGKMCPPCIVYPYVKPPRALAESMPPDWILGKSDSGWMKSDIFYEYVANGLHEYILSNNIKKPIIFFVDGHRSHMSVELSEFCDNNGIILYALPPNSTHIIQPADVSVFKPLKESWRQTVRKWQNENEEKTLTKVVFAPVFKRALENTNFSDHIKRGFKRCGLFPFDPEALDYSKCVRDQLEEVQANAQPVNMVEEPLTYEDFRSTRKVLQAFKTSTLLGEVGDLDQLMERLETFAQETVYNFDRMPNIDRENADELQNIVTGHYGLDNDGMLTLLENNREEEPRINILRIDVIPGATDRILGETDTLDAVNSRTVEDIQKEINISTWKKEETVGILESEGNSSLSNKNGVVAEIMGTEKENLNPLERNSSPSEKQIVQFTELGKQNVNNTDEENHRILEESDVTFKSDNTLDDVVNSETVEDIWEERHSPTREKELVGIMETENPLERNNYLSNVNVIIMETEKGNINPLERNSSSFEEQIVQILESEKENEKNTDKKTSVSENSKDAENANSCQTVKPRTEKLAPLTNNTDVQNKPNQPENHFKKHLRFPRLLPTMKKKHTSGPSTSAISAKAWRSYYIEKDEEKNEKEKARKRKREEAQRNKAEKLAKKKNKKQKTKGKCDNGNQPEVEIPAEKEICSVCQDELFSDAEEDGEKNIGCDACPQWYHLNCTKLAGQAYDDIKDQQFYCDNCAEEN